MAATAMASYYTQAGVVTEQDHLRLAEYYGRGHGAEEAISAGLGCVPTARVDMDPELAAALGLKAGAAISEKEVANILAGLRADGTALPVAHASARRMGGENGTGHRIAYADLCLSAPKGASIAYAFAETNAEKHSILQAIRDAERETLTYIEAQVGRANRGGGRSGAEESARMGWIGFTHFTSRPTVELVNAAGDTELHHVPVAGDMNIHTHYIVPNLVRTESGRLVAMNRDLMDHRIKEFGAVYQAFVSRNLRAIGIDVGLDEKKRLAFLPAIPEHVVKAFSRRSSEGEEGARMFAASEGKDWDALDPAARSAFIKTATQSARLAKGTAPGDGGMAEWRRRAEALGWKHRTAITLPRHGLPEPSREARMQASSRVAQGVLAEELEQRAVVWGSDARHAAAVGLIAGGIESARDIDAITRDMRENGVHHHGQQTTVIWREFKPGKTKLTTALHESQERELIALVREAREDRAADLPQAALEAAVGHLSVKGGVDFTSAHGQAQKASAGVLAASGRWGLMLGSAGVGKTSLAAPLVAARLDAGWEVWGAALSWRQARALRDTGIEAGNLRALQPFLRAVQEGRVVLGPKSEVWLDEVSQVGTHQLLTLARLQKQHGFSVRILGDDKQAQSIEAGPVIELMRRALGEEAIPSIHTTIRQATEREREIAGLFREGKAAEALKLKLEDGTAAMVPGGYGEAVAAVAQRWAERTAAMAGMSRWSITVSAPTNAAAHDVSSAIRAAKIARGDIQALGERRVEAADAQGDVRTLTLAPGDRVRLFARTRGVFEGEDGRKHSAVVGDNGSVLEVRRAGGDGLVLRTDAGKQAFVSWDALRPREGGAIRLAYGDCLTIDSAQGITSDEHIMALPAGSRQVQGFKAYVAASRHRAHSWLITSEGAELREVVERRPAGVEEEPSKADLWANVSRNLSKQDLKESAIGFLEQAAKQANAAAHTLQAAARVKESFRGVTKAARQRVVARQIARHIERVADTLGERVSQTAERPRMTKRYEVSESEAQVQFMDAARAFGLRPKSIIMDGEYHSAPLEGQKGKQSGGYRAMLEGIRPTIILFNQKTKEKATFSANGEIKAVSPEEAAAARARAEESARAVEQKRIEKEADGAARAAALWQGGRPADPQHPYLVKKAVEPHGLRQDTYKGQERLLVPLRDISGKLWNVQTIEPDGTKLYLAGARKQGVYYTLGAPHRMGEPVGIAEGFATAATIRQATGMTVVVALDSGNLPVVANALHKREPARPLVVFADNDGSLPLRTPPLPNVGLEKAQEAAQDVGGKVVAPPFNPEWKDTDWNDHHARHGLEKTKLALRAAWRESEAARPAQKPAQKPGMRM